MIICPKCLHQNVNSVGVCEVCQTDLPSTSSCPNCGASIQVGAQFCGQCGFSLADQQHHELDNIDSSAAANDPVSSILDNPFIFPDPPPPDPLVMPESMSQTPAPAVQPDSEWPSMTDELPDLETPPVNPLIYPEMTNLGNPKTQLQQQTVHLVHVQTNKVIDLPLHSELIHLGKPNDRLPPDIDMSDFPNAEVVSRVHANIRLEGRYYFIEDAGSSNGTFINKVPLLPGNRHRLRLGDRIALGKGNLVTFLFQIN